jgi:hypothetical protein
MSALYGRLLLGQDFIYKLLMAKKQNANIVAIGLLRVMQFRQEFFKASFYNAGGAFPH